MSANRHIGSSAGADRPESRDPGATAGIGRLETSGLLDRLRVWWTRSGRPDGEPNAPRGEVEAQALLAAVVESSDDAIVSKTLDGIITSWNPGAERIFGYAREEALGRPITMLIPLDRLGEERDLVARIRRGERVEIIETRRIHKSGRLLDVSLRVSPVRDRDGRIVGASKIATDVTAAKAFERALREAEDRFRQLAENAPAAIFIKDLAGRYTLANPLAREALGRPSDVIGFSDHDLLPASIADGLRERDRQVIETGKAIEGEEVVERPDFRRRYLSVKFPLFDASGTTVGVCGVAIDVTDRQRGQEALRESEERFRTLADNIAQFAWMADGDGWIFWYNRRWFEYTGTTLEQMEGWGWRAVHHPDHVERVVEKISHCFWTGEVWEDTFPLRAADGTYRWFLSRAIPIRDAEGNLLRWFGTNTDVTDQREAEEALKEADRRKDEFLAVLAHELRNPLAPIRSSLEILKTVEGGETLERSRSVVDRQLAHLERLVDDLLDVARIRSDRLTLRREPLELAVIVERSVETVRPVARGGGIDLRVDLPEDPLLLHADAVRLAQVFSNLLSNACRYTPASGSVSLEARREGDLAVVSVSDSGRGISPDELGRVFEMFARIDPEGDASQGGLGIGLTLVRRLVEMHGGRVEAFSEGLGHGSRFTVWLPLARAREAAGVHDPEPPAPRAAPRRVLVVDDNLDAAESLGQMLEIWGHGVVIAHDGEAAIREAGTFRPEVVLLDIGLPGVDGLEVARRIRAQPWGGAITLVALTGWGQDEDRRRSREAGFDLHLVKPVSADGLRALLCVGPPGDAASGCDQERSDAPASASDQEPERP